jgi:ring-1,2-phenylacetyl-CoA epoxidase subunit PaaC
MEELHDSLKEPLARLLLAAADDKLMLGHRNSDWTGLAPILEEDIAFSSLAQDDIAHAQALYEMAGDLLGKSADELAFGRKPDEYLCASIVQIPDEFDWAIAIARQFYCDHFDHLRLNRLARSGYEPLAALSARLAAEQAVHIDHVDGWVQRLGRGTDESRQRLQEALDRLAPHAAMLFEPTEGLDLLIAEAIAPTCGKDVFETWQRGLERTVHDTDLTIALEPPAGDARGGRHGVHTEHLAPMLEEMCQVCRLEPGAAW